MRHNAGKPGYSYPNTYTQLAVLHNHFRKSIHKPIQLHLLVTVSLQETTCNTLREKKVPYIDRSFFLGIISVLASMAVIAGVGNPATPNRQT